MNHHKVALITGGASGIGLAVARILARKGVRLVLAGRREALGGRVAAELRAEGAEVSFLAADVTDEKSVQGMVEFAVRTYGRLDFAVNNAGIANETRSIDQSETEDFQKMVQTNIVGVYLCMKYEIRQMLKQAGGSIVNVSSIAGLNGIPYAGAYAATKHAVVGLTKSCALDHAAHPIRINAVAPGAVRTDIITGQIALGQYDEPTIAMIHPMGRMGEPEEVAHGIAWLLSDEASFVTGHILSVDGGFQAK